MNYSQADIDFMRKDALRRTREMHQSVNNAKNNVQAKTRQENHEEKIDIPKHDESKKEKCEKKCSTPESVRSENPINSLFSNFFSGGKMDSDKLIIILLIFILAKEGADLKLLLALGYILI